MIKPYRFNMSKFLFNDESNFFIDRVDSDFFYKDYAPNSAQNYHDNNEKRDTETFINCLFADFHEDSSWGNKKIKQGYNFLYEKFSKEVIKSRYENLLKEIDIFIEKKELSKFVEVNTVLLGYAVLDYFTDVMRLKEFHNISNTNTAKIYAYTAYWLVREKPIQIINNNKNEELTLESRDDEHNYLYLNEKFATLYIISNILSDMRIDVFSFDKSYLSEFYNLLLYNFKYRVFTQQTLELMITSFQAGCKVGINR